MKFSNKICLVTGGGSGIGRATCLQMGKEGGIVVVIDRDSKSGNDTADMINKAGRSAMFVMVDVAVPDQIEKGVRAN